MTDPGNVSYATIVDLEQRFEGDIPDNMNEMLTAKIGSAQRFIAAALRHPIAEAIAAGVTTADDVKDVICDMVLRVVRNATGAASQSAGPFSVTVDRTVATASLWLTRENRVQLGLRRRRAGSAALPDDALTTLPRSPRYWPPVGEQNWIANGWSDGA